MIKPKQVATAVNLLLLLTAFIVGGMFISGSTTGNVVLGYVPAVIHPIVGYLIVIVAALLAIMGIWGYVKKLI